MAIGKGCGGLFAFGLGLHLVAQGQHGFVIQFKFRGQFPGGLAFANTAQE